MIIGLTGFAKSGKDTIGEVLVRDHGYKRVAFADAVKAMSRPVTDAIPGNPDKELMRRVWVAVGETFRAADPDYWIKLTNLYGDMVVVTDVRYSNEGRRIREMGGIVLYVGRSKCGPANAVEARTIGEIITEGILDGFIDNNGTPEMAAALALRYAETASSL